MLGMTKIIPSWLKRLCGKEPDPFTPDEYRILGATLVLRDMPSRTTYINDTNKDGDIIYLCRDSDRMQHWCAVVKDAVTDPVFPNCFWFLSATSAKFFLEGVEHASAGVGLGVVVNRNLDQLTNEANHRLLGKGDLARISAYDNLIRRDPVVYPKQQVATTQSQFAGAAPSN